MGNFRGSLHLPDKISKDLHNRMLIEKIEKVIFQLPERRREVFLLSRYEGKSYKEIANILGITVSTVETHMSKALKTMREKFLPLLGLSFFLFCKSIL
ncbi:sigma-70 family RNA polymerase sigma factor [Rhodohalobacter halophilus]|uniref:sigma-70 family RNA polymerase sigma factor n=1 Tax=Rhodohalobacter halophilus TaxID=1812810 RepID=UPI0038B51855